MKDSPSIGFVAELEDTGIPLETMCLVDLGESLLGRKGFLTALSNDDVCNDIK